MTTMEFAIVAGALAWGTGAAVTLTIAATANRPQPTPYLPVRPRLALPTTTGRYGTHRIDDTGEIYPATVYAATTTGDTLNSARTTEIDPQQILAAAALRAAGLPWQHTTVEMPRVRPNAAAGILALRQPGDWDTTEPVADWAKTTRDAA